jgi:hypothetical protein
MAVSSEEGVAHEMKGVVHEMKGVAHEMKGVVHEMKGVAHEMKGVAHETKGVGRRKRRGEGGSSSSSSSPGLWASPQPWDLWEIPLEEQGRGAEPFSRGSREENEAVRKRGEVGSWGQSTMFVDLPGGSEGADGREKRESWCLTKLDD